MSMIKHYLEELSVKMGYGGEITDEVMAKAEDEQARFNDSVKERKREERIAKRGKS